MVNVDPVVHGVYVGENTTCRKVFNFDKETGKVTWRRWTSGLRMSHGRDRVCSLKTWNSWVVEKLPSDPVDYLCP